MNKEIKEIAALGIGIALYVVVSMFVKIPLGVGHLFFDLGYIVFGVYCVLFGWKGCIVGAAGCVIESMLVSGWFPIGWLLGQIFIGISCGYFYNRKIGDFEYLVFAIFTIVSVFIGVAGIKTFIECILYNLSLTIKIAKNSLAAMVDWPPMLIGAYLGLYFKRKKVFV